MADKIKVVMVFEIMGTPKEYINDALAEILGKLGEEKDVKITSKKIHEPKEVENSDLFTSFAEVEAEMIDLQKMMLVMFGYMPAHVEVLSPGEIKIKNFDFNIVCNELVTKLHSYDAIAKTALFNNNMLQKRLQEAIQEGKIKVEVKKASRAKKNKKTGKKK